MKADSVQQTIASGIAPLEVELHAINSVSFDDCMGYRTLLKINSVDLGVMYPEQYRVVTNRNSQCIRLAKYVLGEVLPELDGIKRFVSVYVPAKMLLRGDLYDWLSSRNNIDYTKLSFEFSSDILLDDSRDVLERLNQIKSLGSGLIISEFGDEFCPVLRLGGLPFDSVILDKSLCNYDSMISAKLSSLTAMINDFGMNVIAELPKEGGSEEYSDAVNQAGCIGYIAKEFVLLKRVVGNLG